MQSQQQLVIHNQAIETRIEKMEKDMQTLMNPAMKSVLLKGASRPSRFARQPVLGSSDA